jgi:cytochrome c oxidase subunit 3
MNAIAMPAHELIPEAPATRRFPGNKGIWVGITCELVEFLVLFIVYFVSRAHFPDAFEAGAERLSRVSGTVITLLMVTSSFFIACSVATIRAGQRRRSIYWLVAGLVVSLGYPVAKIMEINWNLAHGINGESGIFFTVYYYLTFNHFVHATWGILGILWVLARHLVGGSWGSALLAGVLSFASPKESSQRKGDPWVGAGCAGSLRYSVSRATR